MALTFTFATSPGSTRGPVVCVIVLDKDNLERMRAGDPFDLQFKAYRQHLPPDLLARELDLVIAYEEDPAVVMRFHLAGDLPGLLAYLERGRVVLPGDCAPPQPVGGH